MNSAKLPNAQNKFEEFKLAMNIYHSNIFYNKFFIISSTTIVVMQIMSVVNLLKNICIDDYFINYTCIAITLFFAYIMTDFINGLAHMYMDNNTNYTSIFGPFIATFHLHHRHIKYTMRNPFLVYFIESGSKFWLILYLAGCLFLQYKIHIPLFTNIFLVAIGILSSFAEVSHYWCHNSNKKNVIINKLQKMKVLLSKKHHLVHHREDNINYAFLNGITDPILNIIAQKLYKGYKKNSDLHTLDYDGHQTQKR